MKVFNKIMIISLLLIAFAFTACGGAPQAVKKDVYDEAYQATAEAEARLAELEAENKQLTEENAARNAKRDALLEMMEGKN